MIAANELRIGNWVFDRGGKKWQIDCWESPNKVAAKSPCIGELFGKPMYGHPFTEEIEYLLPIPLTPEILDKCGFELRKRMSDRWAFLEGYYDYIPSQIVFKFSQDGLVVYTYDEQFEIIKEFTYLRYIHQLQNLYFALTGEELNYKP